MADDFVIAALAQSGEPYVPDPRLPQMVRIEIQRRQTMKTGHADSHTPIAVPCEELDVILNHVGQGTDLPGDVVQAIERVRGRFPGDWTAGTADRSSFVDRRRREAPPHSPLHHAMLEAGWTDRQIGAAMDAASAASPDESIFNTNYEAVVSDVVKAHAASLMQVWIEDGRPDGDIENLVKSVVLHAYASGRKVDRPDPTIVVREDHDPECEFDYPHPDQPCRRRE